MITKNIAIKLNRKKRRRTRMISDTLVVYKCELIKESNTYNKRKKLADYLLYLGWKLPMV